MPTRLKHEIATGAKFMPAPTQKYLRLQLRDFSGSGAGAEAEDPYLRERNDYRNTIFSPFWINQTQREIIVGPELLRNIPN